jgi:SAM-dependent methyltransferase
MNRNELLLSLIDPSGIGLEIGPGYNPLVPKSSGRRIETVDHATAAELRDKYRDEPLVDVSVIEELDYVSDGRSLVEIINKPGYYDYIVASHVIEHTPDMLGFLKDCETLLRHDGALVLAVPDKRRCFDVFLPLTSTGMVLQAHVERRTRHTPGQIFDHIAYKALRAGTAGWGLGSDGPLTLVHDAATAHARFRHEVSSTAYTDTHAWQFTPSSFRLILHDLHQTGELGLREQFFSEGDGFEFFVSLSRRASGCPFDRLTLARMTVVEQHEIAVGAMVPVAPLTNGRAPVDPPVPPTPERQDRELGIVVSRGDRRFEIEPAQFETFAFEQGDVLQIVPAEKAAALPVKWGDTSIKIEDGRAIRVPERMEFFHYKGYRLAVHLINLTGAGYDTFDWIGKAHMATYRKHVGLRSDMSIVELGCGIGRDALQLIDVLDASGRYVGIDVTRDSVLWCQQNISPAHPNFSFHHFDAENEIYNPYGAQTSMEFRIPAEDGSVDRILLASVFTHLLPQEVLHYMREFRRVLKPSGLVYASFFLWSKEAIEAAETKGNAPFKAFTHAIADGAYCNDPEYPRGGVAFTEPAMRGMIESSGLQLARPFLKGWWSGLHDEPEDAQDVAILARADGDARLVASSQDELRILVNRGNHSFEIQPAQFETFAFESGDRLRVTPAEKVAALPITWGDINIKIADGHAIRVPQQIEFFPYKGFDVPVHLINLTGAGPDTLERMGRRHVELYCKHVGLRGDMTIVELGCGIGRDAFELIDLIDANGRYLGIDVTRDSIRWCQQHITPRHPQFRFYHFDAEHELYNPYGTQTSMDFRLPVEDDSVDRIVLSSVFTHLFPAEVLHYMTEFRRVLKTSGLVYASFFLWSEAAIAAAQTRGNTSWKATFAHRLADGAYANDPAYPRGAVAFTDAAMRQMIESAGLRLAKPYLNGWWSGLHEDYEDGQEVAILARADGVESSSHEEDMRPFMTTPLPVSEAEIRP